VSSSVGWTRLYARMALGAAFLSAVASRFGIWGGNNFQAFERYTAEVNSFMPSWSIPFLARAATFFEALFGIGLLLGIRLRWFAAGGAILLGIFGAAMSFSFGLKSPLDYSVFSASACAALLACESGPKEAGKTGAPKHV